uniref:Homing endonuclease LAGLIDADG domain-containing protein n=1 Tax=Candida chauliodis TaxID=391825 RepID=S5U6C1_9ASCO|nr:hypothetical protein [Candida chauliodis]AGS44621.1 hypothetical protein [Candida chauliodis]
MIPILILVFFKTNTNILINKEDFNFNEFNDLYLKYYPYRKLPNKEFLEWFVGYFESEGNMIMGKSAQSFDIVVSDQNKYLLEIIQSNLGLGSISIHSKQNKNWAWTVKNSRQIILICLLLNGNLVLPTRYTKFISFLSLVNIRLVKNNEKIINIKSNIRLPSLKDHWLAGFTDAEGNFNININKQIISYSIEQKQLANKYVLEYIKELFDKDSGIRDLGEVKVNSKNYWEYSINGIKVNKVFNYFDKYKLINKRINYDIFKELLLTIDEWEHLDKRDKIRIKSKLINSKNKKGK